MKRLLSLLLGATICLPFLTGCFVGPRRGVIVEERRPVVEERRPVVVEERGPVVIERDRDRH